MDPEGISIAIAEAVGKATAVVCIQSALIDTLRVKKILTDGEVAMLSAAAAEALQKMSGLDDAARTLAESALRGFAKSWTKRVTKN